MHLRTLTLLKNVPLCKTLFKECHSNKETGHMIMNGELRNVTDINSLEETDTVVLLLGYRELLK